MKKIFLLVCLSVASLSVLADINDGSKHYVTAEAGIGYSTLTAPNFTAPGFLGGRAQVGYEWNYHQLLFHTGLEAAFMRSALRAKKSGVEDSKHSMVELNLPIMVGGLFGENMYAMGGIRLGLPVWYQTGLTEEKMRPGVNGQLSGEIGWRLQERNSMGGSWSMAQKHELRLGLFMDAGLFNTGLPVKKTHSILVGLKFSALFELFRPRMAPKAAYGKITNPNFSKQSWLNINILNKATRQPINAVLTLHDDNTNEEIRTEVRGGMTKKRARRGQWTLTAQATNFKSDTQTYSLETINGETIDLEFLLENQAKLHVTVTHSVTGKPLNATVTIINADNGAEVETLNTDVNGQIEQQLQEGPHYKVRVQHLGYQAQTIEVQSIGDDIHVALRPMTRGQKMVIHNILFATNKTDILPASRQPLNELYEFLSENPSMRVRIIGHTDAVGSDEANLRLSQGRCDSVKKNMSDRGISESRMETSGRGETEPIDTNDTAEGRANNRRVEFEILSD